MLIGIREIVAELKKMDIAIFGRHWEWVAISIAAISYTVSNFVDVPDWAYLVVVVAAIVSLFYRHEIAAKREAKT